MGGNQRVGLSLVFAIGLAGVTTFMATYPAGSQHSLDEGPVNGIVQLSRLLNLRSEQLRERCPGALDGWVECADASFYFPSRTDVTDDIRANTVMIRLPVRYLRRVTQDLSSFFVAKGELNASGCCIEWKVESKPGASIMIYDDDIEVYLTREGLNKGGRQVAEETYVHPCLADAALCGGL